MENVILQIAPVPMQLTQRLHQHFTLFNAAQLTTEQQIELIPQVRVLLINGETPLDDTTMARYPNLQLIAVFGVVYERVDAQAAYKRNIQISNTPGVLTDDVADLAFGLMLACSRQIVGAQRFIERGDWAGQSYRWTNKVSGSRLGILGLGRIGRAIARRASAFDMSVSYHSRTQYADFAGEYCATPQALAAHCDFLVVCAPGGDGSRDLVNAEVLQALGPTGILINIARGSVVDEAALVNAIEHKLIAGAGLDVFCDEPHVPATLLQRDNVVITPHMGSATESTRRAMSELVYENISAYFAGKPLLTATEKP